MEGYYGNFGGQYVLEEIKNALKEVEEAFYQYKDDEEFKSEYMYYLNNYVGRPSPLYYAKRLTEYLGRAKIYL